jgi:hypothetical protein
VLAVSVAGLAEAGQKQPAGDLLLRTFSTLWKILPTRDEIISTAWNFLRKVVPLCGKVGSKLFHCVEKMGLWGRDFSTLL